ncbi:class I SAM-dependent methyltransferase [Amycolatopsis mediterranei]|uniref:class I SAM-dependent methyltransferase n=1 Tax=Amycolatopsis mediterranei TaxID=33910 RepID=UPI00341FAF50
MADLVLGHVLSLPEVVVDIGGGSGAVVKLICARTNARIVVNLDPSPGFEAHADGALRVAGRAEALPFSDNSIDLIYSYGVFHHLDVPVALADVARTLKPGGLAVIADFITENGRPRQALTLIFDALRAFRGYRANIGLVGAVRVVGYRLSPGWLNHARSDRLLSPSEFHKIYTNSLHSVNFDAMAGAMVAVWRKPGG